MKKVLIAIMLVLMVSLLGCNPTEGCDYRECIVIQKDFEKYENFLGIENERYSITLYDYWENETTVITTTRQWYNTYQIDDVVIEYICYYESEE